MTREEQQNAQLRSLEKWRESLLEKAQADHVQKQKQVERSEHAVSQVRSTIDDSAELARSQMALGSVVSVDSLTRIRHFAAAKTIELEQAQETLEKSRAEAAETRILVCEKLQELAVVERLRARRSQQLQTENLRREQKGLDDQAILRIASDRYDRKFFSKDGSK